MARITIWGDFKVNKVENLNVSDELTMLLSSSDVNVVNFEAPLKSDGKPIRKSGPNICQDINAPEWIEKQGFNIVSLANNHALDFGLEGLEATKAAFKIAKVIGCGTWDNAYRLEVVETSDELKIGFLACTHCEFGTLTDVTRKSEQGTAWACALDFGKTLQNRGNSCDFLIVIAHCGVEYMEQPLPEWREIYKRWIELGADAVIASHPHVPQGWEIHQGKPICYSLGNFCFDQLGKKDAPINWYNSLCCILDIDKSKGISLTIRPVTYDAEMCYIRDSTSNEFKTYLNRVNTVLAHEEEYMAYVKKYVIQILPHYMNQFSRGGLVHNPFSMGFIKGLVDGFLGRVFFKNEHWLNNIQCESHRWTILRALNQKR